MREYKELITLLYRLKGEKKHPLTHMKSLDEALGFPSQAFPCVHVAGTNGKGSVATKIARAYSLAGYKTGLYTSPHITSFTERIQIDGEYISEDRTTFFLHKIFSLLREKQVEASFFEITTLLAFLFFAEKKVDMAILETGLGGRLDATNIVTPLLSIITSIALDHTHVLGNSLAEITKEKAGIIKPNIPILIGPHVERKEIMEIAEKLHSPIIEVTGAYDSYDAENSAIALKALEYLNLPESAAKNGITARPPCRLETKHFLGKTLVFDVAHNPNGLSQLFHALEALYANYRYRIVFGFSKGKNIEECASILQKHGICFYPVSSPNELTVPAASLAAEVTPSRLFADIRTAVRQAIDDTDPKTEVLVICGSFYIMDGALSALK